ncbi:MAG: polysaccharide biosynthesis C-terminal domain-containing protein [Bacteroidetes bacterium]|nr:polysaccharide biosynthesis C-terminal domain-containing protein [Bacteroidota bacterium]
MTLKRNIGSAFILQIVTAAFMFLSTVLIARYLLPQGRGIYSLYFNSVNFIVLLIGLGLSSAITFYHASGKITAQVAFWVSLMFTSISGLFFFFLLMSTSSFNLFYKMSGIAFTMKNAAIFTLFCFLLQFSQCIMAIFNARKEFITSGIIGFINPAAVTIGIGSLYFLSNKDVALHSPIVNYALLITMAGYLLQVTVAIYFLIRIKAVTFRFNLSQLNVKELLFYSTLAYFSNIIQYLSYRSDYWFIDHYHDKAPLGIYSIAVMIGSIIWMLPSAIATVLLSHTSANQANNAAQTATLCRITFFISLVSGIVLYALFGVTTNFIFGSEYAQASYLLLLLLPGIILFSLTKVLGGYFAGANKIKINLTITIISAIVNMGFNFLLIPAQSSEGAAISSSISYTLSTLLSLIIFARIHKISINRLLFISKEDVLLIKQTVNG